VNEGVYQRRRDAIIPLGAMPLDAMAGGGPDYSATPSDLRIQKRNNSGASTRDPSVPIERKREREREITRAPAEAGHRPTRVGRQEKSRGERRRRRSSPHSLPKSPGERQWRLAGRAAVATAVGGVHEEIAIRYF